MSRKTIKTILWSILIAGILIGIFCFALVSRDPRLTPAVLNDADYFTGAKLTQNVLYRTLKSKNNSELRTLKISNREMQSLMNLAENGDSLLYLITGKHPHHENGKNEIYNIDYDRGVFNFTIKLTDNWLGLCFVASGQAGIAFNNGKLNIDFYSLKIGRTGVPGKCQEKIKKYIYEYLKNETAYDAVRASVRNIEFDKSGDVNIHYYPYRLRKYFKKNIF